MKSWSLVMSKITMIMLVSSHVMCYVLEQPHTYCLQRNLQLCTGWRIEITVQSMLHLPPLGESGRVSESLPYLETLLPLKSTSSIIHGGSPADVLFWQRCLYEEVLPPT
jgi:hypothetical protein